MDASCRIHRHRALDDPETAGLEPDYRNRVVFDLNIRMIHVGPVAEDFHCGPSVPEEEVDVVG